MWFLGGGFNLFNLSQNEPKNKATLTNPTFCSSAIFLGKVGLMWESKWGVGGLGGWISHNNLTINSYRALEFLATMIYQDLDIYYLKYLRGM